VIKKDSLSLQRGVLVDLETNRKFGNSRMHKVLDATVNPVKWEFHRRERGTKRGVTYIEVKGRI